MNIHVHKQLSKLPSIFIKNAGIVTAGNASGICDGATAIIISNEGALKKYNLKPLARLVGYHKQLSDIDLFDINEAFAPQFLVCQKVLILPNEKRNLNGGAIALGHPCAASGARITANRVYELRCRQGKYAIGVACIRGWSRHCFVIGTSLNI
ncbi:unnamed protein product [Rotaria magnacalcarata]|uniref:Uncharacterized protein n=1 Tax=Rotaria magnacalcarata TaxID=392030 RepID=A0A816YZE4_9BILA|nr:unnamed protein product [Rotaria magnacalcarata]